MRYPSRKDYPRTWLVNGDVWQLRFVRKIKDGDGDNLGLTDPSIYTIFIKIGQTKKEILHTFFHEACHAIEFSYDVDTGSKNFNYKKFHDFIYDFESYLAAFFRDNWAAFTCLFFGIDLLESNDVVVKD